MSEYGVNLLFRQNQAYMLYYIKTHQKLTFGLRHIPLVFPFGLCVLMLFYGAKYAPAGKQICSIIHHYARFVKYRFF